ncbi:MAG: glycosyltransferase family 4 protein [Pseudomonadota bacterium]
MRAVFAIPGDKDQRTGGFIYEATVLRVLNEIGCPTEHMVLPERFPDPSSDDMAEALALLQAVPRNVPIILDGLVFGAIDPDGLADMRAPVIAMIHHPLGLETGLSPERARYLKENERRALAHAAHVIVPSPHTAAILERDYGADPKRITIALPGFERPDLTAAPQRVDPPLILSVGLLAPRKGHDVLVEALGAIQDLPWQAQIVGKTHDPATADALLAQSERLGLQDRVTSTGELAAQALTERFAQASVFALATRYEGYGMVLSEAMLFGLPVVSCKVGAVPDTVGDAGLLVAPDEPMAFAEALRRVLSDPDTASDLRHASATRAAGLPTWEQTAAHFVDVIEDLKHG